MELWDLYDIDRNKLGETAQRGDGLPEGIYHVVVHLCIFNDQGQLLIQQRQPFKKGWSGLWDISVGGSALAGETSAQAVKRELKEELGLDHDFEGIRPAMTVNFKYGFDDIYVIERNVDIASELTLQYEEVKDARWASLSEIKEMIDEGTFVPYFKPLLDIFDIFRKSRGCIRLD